MDVETEKTPQHLKATSSRTGPSSGPVLRMRRGPSGPAKMRVSSWAAPSGPQLGPSDPARPGGVATAFLRRCPDGWFGPRTVRPDLRAYFYTNLVGTLVTMIVAGQALAHLWPHKWDHINLTGDCRWPKDGGRRRRLRPLGTVPAAVPQSP